MKKMIFAAIITMLLSLNIIPVCAATEVNLPSVASEEPVSPASAETVWYTRIYNGKLQMRLWSVTYGEWLTEWEDVE